MAPGGSGVPGRPLALGHIINLAGRGGLERDFLEFLRCCDQEPLVTSEVFLTGTTVDGRFLPLLKQRERPPRYLGHVHRLRIPKRLGRLRQARIAAQLTAPPLAGVVLWNNPSWIEHLPARIPGVYYEHGAAWYPRRGETLARGLRAVAGVICNSFAAKRMLELRHGADPPRTIVCANAVRQDCHPAGQGPRQLEPGRALRLGVAGRLEPIKGFPLVLHALARLVRDGVDALLEVAGDGGDRERLEALAGRLGVAGRVRFRGRVEPISTFYREIDLFLCPSLREPFGLVAAEAQLHGVPVIATAVDGLPEVVRDGDTGRCLTPSLSVADYVALGGVAAGMPEVVYDPAGDRLRAPLAVTPEALARATVDLAGDREGYRRMSAAAVTWGRQRFAYRRHVDEVLGALQRLLGGPRPGRPADPLDPTG